jgi:hypothetical protein
LHGDFQPVVRLEAEESERIRMILEEKITLFLEARGEENISLEGSQVVPTRFSDNDRVKVKTLVW